MHMVIKVFKIYTPKQLNSVTKTNCGKKTRHFIESALIEEPYVKEGNSLTHHIFI